MAPILARLPSSLTLAVDGGTPVLVGTVQVDAGDVQWTRSEGGVRADPGWEHVDEHGHVHRWVEHPIAAAADPVIARMAALPTLTRLAWASHPPQPRTSRWETPTLEARHVDMPCDGSCAGRIPFPESCEGYTVTTWHCRECGDEVERGYVPDEQARGSGIPMPRTGPTWRFELEGSPVAHLRQWTPDGPFRGELAEAGHTVTGRVHVDELLHRVAGEPSTRVTFVPDVDEPAEACATSS